MAINPGTSVIATQDNLYKAVVPVDIKNAVADPNVVSAYAQVVVLDGSASSSVVTQPTAANLNAQVVGNVASGAADAGNPVKVAGVYRATSPTLADGQRGDLQLGTRGSLNVTIFPANNATPGGFQVNNSDAIATTATTLATTGFGSIFNGSTWDRLKKSTTTGRIVSSSATTNATSVKASAGSVHVIVATNTTAALKYLKLYNKASAPTVGTDTPVLTIALSPSNAQTRVEFPNTMNFATGIAMALTGAAADSDTTALAAGDVVGVNITYD